MKDEDFEPRLGRVRARGSARGKKYLHRVLAATALAGGMRRAGGRRFGGSRIGRGAAMARLLGSRDRYAGLRRRRAIIKTRLVRLGGKGLTAARAHLRYIQRDGVQRDGAPGQLYVRDRDPPDGKAFLARADGDRHQFRFIVSAEDGAEYDDLKPLTRRFMAQMEADLGTRLDWVAVDHLDTGHPHTHIMLRGKDDRGENLVIARDYIARGMRERLAELVTLDLGPRTDLEIERKLRLDVGAERMTAIDRQLLREAGADQVVSAGHRSAFQHALRAGRLKKLEAMGLAEKLCGRRWKLAEGLEERLRAMGERGDIVRTMQRALRANGLDRLPADRIVQGVTGQPVVGRLVARGLSDELSDRHYLIVDAVDGRVHHIDIGRADAVEPLPEGTIVRASPAVPEVRRADRIIAEIAAAHGGRYSMDIHRRHDPTASEEFARAHVRRLEAVRRGGGALERSDDGSWNIPPDYLERAVAFEEAAGRRHPVRIELLSPLPLQQLAAAQGATWLDRELVSLNPEPLRDAGFGSEVRSGLAMRRQWLVAEGLAQEGPGGMVYSADMLASLRRRELLRVAAAMAEELGLPYLEARKGMEIGGRLERRLDLASGRFALIANGREFTLVPWRRSLEWQLGHELEARVGSAGVDWTIGRGRGGPEIG
jgi:type IV secretory pathway VirD2 relaxase